MKLSLIAALLMVSVSASAASVCDHAEKMALDFVKKQYAARTDLGKGPTPSEDSANTYREICRKGIQQGIKGDHNQLDALLAEIRDQATSADIDIDDAHDMIGDMTIILVYKAGYIEGKNAT